MPHPAPFASLPAPPYFAVIFSSRRRDGDHGYENMAEHMLALAHQQAGFLGAEGARNDDGFGITVSYWASREAITAWKAHVDHVVAQDMGRQRWYADYQVRIAQVERANGASFANAVT